MPMDSGYAVEEVTSLARFREIADEWDLLCDRALESCPTLRHAVLDAWLVAFGQHASLRIVLVRRASVLVLAAPIIARQERLLRRDRAVLSTMCNSWLDRSYLLAATLDPVAIDALLARLGSTGRRPALVVMGPLDDQGPVARQLLERAGRQGWSVGAEEVLGSPSLRLPPTWEALLGELTGASRSAVRRKLSHAEKTPGLQLSVVRDGSAWEAIASISPHTWQAVERTSMTSTPELRDFYASFVRDAARRGSLRCGLLCLDGQPVAFDLNIFERGVMYSLKMGFRQEHAALSAGAVLKAFVLRACFAEAERVTTYDFMGEAEPYKMHWTSEVRAYSRLFLFPPAIRHRVTHWTHFVARPWIRTHAPGLWMSLKRLGRTG